MTIPAKVKDNTNDCEGQGFSLMKELLLGGGG